MAREANSRRGIGVDYAGDQAFDPSENVKALNEAANKRQDDLREANNRLSESEFKRLDAALVHMKEILKLQADHAKEISAAEASRLDAIRQVDVTAVRTEADRALAAIQLLAATTSTNADNIRNTLNSTAVSIAKSTSDTVSQITERIAALEKSSYEGVGKQRLADPQMVDLLAEVKLLREGAGVKTGVDKTWGILAAVVTIAIAGIAAFAAINHTPAPQVIYAPVPPVVAPPVR